MASAADLALIDQKRLRTACIHLLGIAHDEFPGVLGGTPHDIPKALYREGIMGLHEDFAHLTVENIDALQYQDGAGVLHNLKVKDNCQLRSMLAFFHWKSAMLKKPMIITATSADEYKEFRLTYYSPAQEIVPWSLALSNNENLRSWNPNIKPNGRDFPIFRDLTGWVEFK